MKETIAAIVFFLVLALIWQGIASWLLAVNPGAAVLLPSPGDVGRYIIGALTDGDTGGGGGLRAFFGSTLVTAMIVTMRRLFLGYFLGILIGLPLGLMTSRSRLAEVTLGVMALGLQTLPSVCWVPLALLWFGQTEAAMLFVVIMGTLWSVLIATDNGVRTVPPIYVRAARTMGSKRLHTWIQVVLPASLPFIVSGMKQGWAFAWRSLMAAEIYVTILTGFGLGHLLHYGRELHAMDQVIAIMLVIIVIGLLTDKVLFSPWERFLHRRWGTSRS